MSLSLGGSLSRSAAAWRGMSLRKISQPSGSVEKAIATAQDTKMPRTGSVPAKTARRASFPTENTAFPAGTHSALRRPVSTPSWRVSSAQATHAATNTAPAMGVPSGAYDAPQVSSVSRNTAAASATTSELTAYVPHTRRPVSRPARGTKRTTAPIIVVAVMLASSRIAAMAAEPCPTASSE